ncbi:MAG TPA: alpha/beta hydrolase [Phnomibacter sp.]|nr:alpha/beta hydrolase [Phnomibacter sp.]
MKYILTVGLCLLVSAKMFSQDSIPLWPRGKMPNSRGLAIGDSTNNEFVFRVMQPRMFAYLAPKEINTGAAVLIVPGGGYLRLPVDNKDLPIARYFQSKGINAFVLCHRLPVSPDNIRTEIAPLQDAQRAMRMIRANAKQWNIDTAKIGACGTSAGGHVVSTLGTHLQDISAIGDGLNAVSYRPAFLILVSPVISFNAAIAHKGSRDRLLNENLQDSLVYAYSNENRVTSETPPCLLIHANDDATVSSMNSIVFYQALLKAKRPASLHIYPYGGHGIKLDKGPGSAALSPTIAIEWLREMKFIP